MRNLLLDFQAQSPYEELTFIDNRYLKLKIVSLRIENDKITFEKNVYFIFLSSQFLQLCNIVSKFINENSLING